jgi:hypothetical protein
MWQLAASFVYWLRTLPGAGEAYAEWEHLHRTVS